jgi:hypothetical protein
VYSQRTCVFVSIVGNPENADSFIYYAQIVGNMPTMSWKLVRFCIAHFGYLFTHVPFNDANGSSKHIDSNGTNDSMNTECNIWRNLKYS